MQRLIPLVFCAAFVPTASSAIVIYEEEARVSKTIEEGTSVSEEMRVYSTDGTHINAIVIRIPFTVTYTSVNGVVPTQDDKAELRLDALQCDDGHVENVSEGDVGDLYIFRFDCVSRR